MGSKKSIVKSTLSVTVFSFFIKVLGVIKQSLIAKYCGASENTDIFFLSSGIMIALSTIIISSITVPLVTKYTQRLHESGREKANNLINAVLFRFLPFAFLSFLFFFFFSPNIAIFLAPSYSNTQSSLLIKYLRILSSLLILSCYYLIVDVPLLVEKRFLPGKGFSFFLDIFIILSLFFLYQSFGIISLIYATVGAGIAQCIQITVSARKIYRIKRNNVKNDSNELLDILKTAIPVLIGSAVYEVNDVVDKMIATRISEGGVSFLSYGASLNEIVVTIIVSSLSTVLFSSFAAWVVEDNKTKIEEVLRIILESLAAILLPITIMMIICGEDVVSILYYRGQFDSFSVSQTYFIVVGYSLGFVFQAFRAVLSRFYYAYKNTRLTMINGILSVSINIALSILLSRIVGVSGIAIATSFSMMFSSILLISNIKRFLPSFSILCSIKEFGKNIVIFSITLVISFYIHSKLNFSHLVSIIIIGIIVVLVYILLMALFRVRCLSILIKKTRNYLGFSGH